MRVFLNIVIWFMCINMTSAIQVFFRYQGIILGAIPTMLLFGLMIFSAISLTKLNNNHWNKKKQEKQRYQEWIANQEQLAKNIYDNDTIE